MSINDSDKLVSALQALKREQARELPPAERRRLLESIEAAYRIAKAEEVVADAKEATLGVIADLKGRSTSEIV
jgi:hypothetical protein